MKKYFIKHMFDDEPSLFMAIGFIVFTPVWIIFMINNGFSIMIFLIVVLSFIHIIRSYIKFNSEEYKKEKDITKRFESLTIEEKEKALTKLKK